MKDRTPASCESCPVAAVATLEKLGMKLGKEDFVVALAGNPNTGKSTVFNALTGLRQHTGNWPGKTVEQQIGEFGWDGRRFEVIDLPGTYGLLAVSAPIIVGVLFKYMEMAANQGQNLPDVAGGAEAVGGLLAGALVSGVMLALFMANAGGAWDNAKKYIEQDGLARLLRVQFGEDWQEHMMHNLNPEEIARFAKAKDEYRAKVEASGGSFDAAEEADARAQFLAGQLGKGSDPHKAAVVGDTVGDPCKDTAGPSLNILIKLMSVVSLVIAPLILTETVLQAKYFLGLNPEVITSCCGSLFTADTKGVASEIISWPLPVMEIIFYAAMIGALALGAVFYRTGKMGYAFAAAMFLTLLISVASFISFISIYFYELPTHHCPFCILQKEYGYIGYCLYLLLLVGGLAGMGVGLLMPFRHIPSLEATLPTIQKHLALTAIIFYLLFTVIATYQIIFSNLKM